MFGNIYSAKYLWNKCELSSDLRGLAALDRVVFPRRYRAPNIKHVCSVNLAQYFIQKKSGTYTEREGGEREGERDLRGNH